MLIRTEQTPNPATRKFLPEQIVMEVGTRDFPDAESAEATNAISAVGLRGESKLKLTKITKSHDTTTISSGFEIEETICASSSE